jgi:hypothetical protein
MTPTKPPAASASQTIAALLDRTADAGFEVRIWYVGLRSPELHIERVRARVASRLNGRPPTSFSGPGRAA